MSEAVVEAEKAVFPKAFMYVFVLCYWHLSLALIASVSDLYEHRNTCRSGCALKSIHQRTWRSDLRLTSYRKLITGHMR